VSDDFAATDLLPLLFTTALVVYVLAFGSADLARSVIRLAALAMAAFSLFVWGAAALSHDGWGAPVIEEFYAMAFIVKSLGGVRAGWVLLALGLVPAGFCLAEFRTLATRSR
jgi:hypothetical protein